MAHTVLVLDDDPDQAATIAHSLRRHGYSVVVAHTPPEALAAADCTHLDAIVSDWHLAGGESGIEVCRRIRCSRPDVPTVFMSTSDVNELAVQSLDLAPAAVLEKGLDTTVDLIAVLELELL